MSEVHPRQYVYIFMFNLLREVFFFTRLQREKRQSQFGFTSGNSVKRGTDPVGQIRNFQNVSFSGTQAPNAKNRICPWISRPSASSKYAKVPTVGAKCSSFPYLSLWNETNAARFSLSDFGIFIQCESQRNVAQWNIITWTQYITIR